MNATATHAPARRQACTLADLPPPPAGRTGWPWTEACAPLPPTLTAGAEWPTISIVTPSFNQAQYLEETIRSILLQGYPKLEYYIIDGGSTDGSVEVIRRYEPWLSGWVSERDSGQSEAINKGFNRCTGELFNWICSDDVLSPDALGTVARAFADESEPDVVAGSCYCLYEKDASRSALKPSWVERIQARPYAFGVWQPSCFFRRTLIRRGLLVRTDLHYCMDRELWCYLCSENAVWKQVDACLSVYRFTGENKSVTGKQKVIAEIDELYRTYGGDRVPLTYWLRHVWLPLLRVQKRHPLSAIRIGARLISGAVSLALRAVYPQERVKVLRAEFLSYELW